MKLLIIILQEANSRTTLFLSHNHVKVTDVKPEQIHKITIIFTQSGQKLSFWVKIVVIFKISSALATVTLFSAWDKSRDLSANSQQLEQM